MVNKERLLQWQKTLEKTETPQNGDWEFIQNKRRNGPDYGSYHERYGHLWYTVLNVSQTDSGMIRVDVDTDQYSQLTEEFWVTVGNMVKHLSEAENQNLEVKVRPV